MVSEGGAYGCEDGDCSSITWTEQINDILKALCSLISHERKQVEGRRQSLTKYRCCSSSAKPSNILGRRCHIGLLQRSKRCESQACSSVELIVEFGF